MIQEGRLLVLPMHRTPFFNTTPIFGEGVELGGRVWYPMKLLHISDNLFAGTEMPRLRANRNKNFAWGDRPPI